jgi:C-terminal processing protease CtpA/Prc
MLLKMSRLKVILVLIFCLIIIATTSCHSPNSTIDINLGFEKTSPGENMPDNWKRLGPGYNICIDSIIKHSGKNSLMIEGLYSKPVSNFGSIVCEIPALYAGKEIELRAYMKLENIIEGSANLFLRIEGEDGFNNLQNKKIDGTRDWAMYSIKLAYPSEVKNIHIGALNSGKGKLWVDDFELLIDGKDFTQAKKKEIKYKAEKDYEFDKGSKISSIVINKNSIDNLTILGKVWGFLKYYHPNIAKGDFNWDYELFRVLPEIINAKGANIRDEILSNWIDKLGDFDVNKYPKEIRDEIKIKPDLDWITNSGLNKNLADLLLKIKNAKRNNDHYYIKFAANINNPIFRNENKYNEMKYPDVGYRILSLFRYWNIIQYYFPYKNLIDEDWKKILREFVPQFINAKNELEYKLAVLKLIAKVHDTHANIWGTDDNINQFNGLNCMPVQVSFVENKVVVTDFYDEILGKETGLIKGDVISRINNQSVDDMIKSKLEYAPASNYITQLRSIVPNLIRTNDSILKVQFIRNGKTEMKEFKTYSINKFNFYKKYQKNDTCFKFIDHNIAYLYLGTITSQYLSEFMNKIKKTKGLIIDLRCYPSEFVVFTLGEYLVKESIPFVKFSRGSITEPGYFTIETKLGIGMKNNNYYKGKVIILVNENTQSQAEYTAMALRVAPNAKVIGSQTAGADGNVSAFFLPGGIKTMISGIGVYYPDGRETQRIGIVPDVEVNPTIEGIKQGKDEVLEKAIEMINQK